MIRRVVTVVVLAMVVALGAVAVLSWIGAELAPKNATALDRAGLAAEKLLGD